MANSIQTILDEKIDQSCRAMRSEKNRDWFFGSLEIVTLTAVFIIFFAIVYFVFWGPGYSIFAKAQHDYTVSALTELPGPHQALIEKQIQTVGYLSLLDYRKYVEMANDYKLENSASPAVLPSAHFAPNTIRESLTQNIE